MNSEIFVTISNQASDEFLDRIVDSLRASIIAKCRTPYMIFASDVGTELATASMHGVVMPGCMGIRFSSELM